LVTFRQISEPPIFPHHAGAVSGIDRELDRYQVTALNAVKGGFVFDLLFPNLLIEK
jgi:hypothetical protein